MPRLCFTSPPGLVPYCWGCPVTERTAKSRRCLKSCQETPTQRKTPGNTGKRCQRSEVRLRQTGGWTDRQEGWQVYTHQLLEGGLVQVALQGKLAQGFPWRLVGLHLHRVPLHGALMSNRTSSNQRGSCEALQVLSSAFKHIAKYYAQVFFACVCVCAAALNRTTVHSLHVFQKHFSFSFRNGCMLSGGFFPSQNNSFWNPN